MTAHPPPTGHGLHAIADALLEQPCLGYSVQASLVQGHRALSAAQREIQRLLDVELFETPTETLHLSVHTIIPVRSTAPDKERAWHSAEAVCRRELARLGECPAFELEFVELRVMPSAVVALARDPNGSVAKLRARLRSVTASSADPAPAYDIVHTTLVRFRNSSIIAAETVAQVAAIELAASVRISELRLVRESVYPSLLVEELARTVLAAT